MNQTMEICSLGTLKVRKGEPGFPRVEFKEPSGEGKQVGTE